MAFQGEADTSSAIIYPIRRGSLAISPDSNSLVKGGVFYQVRRRFIDSFENFFYRHGQSVSQRPLVYIACVVFVTAICSIGLLNLQQENRPFKLWLPQNSDFVITYDWMQRNFPRQFYLEYAIVTADNVLEPSVIRKMSQVRQMVSSAHQPAAGTRWSDVCLRLPSIVAGDAKQSTEPSLISVDDENLSNNNYKSLPDDRVNSLLLQNDNFTRFRRQIPLVDFDVSSMDSVDPSVIFPASFYCSILDELPTPCWESNLLEIWAFNDLQLCDIENLNQVVERVNSITASPVFGYRFDPTRYLGSIQRNSTGHIVGARAAFFTWAVERELDMDNASLAEFSSDTSDIGTGEMLDARTVLFESHFLSVMSKASSHDFQEQSNCSNSSSPSNSSTHDINWYYNAVTSFGNVSSAAVFGDVRLLVIGYVVMFIFVELSLGRFHPVEHRVLVSLAGVFSVFLAVLISYGVCSAIGLRYGPVHNILPLLLLGLGVDDMFVILQCLNVQQAEMEKTEARCSELISKNDVHSSDKEAQKRQEVLKELMGGTMRRAGCSITVTSVTDIAAFAVGATTSLPALRSFCAFAAVGVLAVYVIQATWLAAFVALDQRRIAARRDGLLPCIKHGATESTTAGRRCYSSGDHWLNVLFERVYSPALLSYTGKCITMLVTVVMFALNCWGAWQLRQEFNPLWFLPTDTYLAQYYRQLDQHFASRSGADGVVLIGGVDIAASLPQMALLSRQLAKDESIERVDSWYDQFEFYVNYHSYGELPERFAEGRTFQQMLGQFLFSARGGKFRHHFRFAGRLQCGEPAPAVLATMIAFSHKPMNDGPSQHVPAMLRVKQLVSDIAATMVASNLTAGTNGSGIVMAPLSQAYAGWETDAVIGVELWRNLALALLCVLIVTGVLIIDMRVCLLVLACVLLTLLNVAGLMAHWGLTVDTVSCIDLVLAVGLCVDYAVHIGHAFVSVAASKSVHTEVDNTVSPGQLRNQCAAQVLSNIGPAVFCGALSTFLAFVFLADSNSHVFITFYKVFLGVTVFGAWHGLAALPVVLSLIGPLPPGYDQSLPRPCSTSHINAPSSINTSF